MHLSQSVSHCSLCRRIENEKDTLMWVLLCVHTAHTEYNVHSKCVFDHVSSSALPQKAEAYDGVAVVVHHLIVVLLIKLTVNTSIQFYVFNL